ncbi:MAG: T9SS type A sorting domain-containing protein, partial [bacterium]
VELVDMIPGYTEPTINSFAFKDTLLYAGGTFSEIGNTYAKHIAVWNGRVWKPLGSGTNGRIETIAVFNNELYVGGFFSQIDNVSAKNIAKWNGGQWVEVGGGTDGTVQDMKVSPDGKLIVGGNFFKCGPNETGSLVKWDGQKWIPFSIPVRGSIVDIAFANNSIFIGGGFRIMADSEIYTMAAKWNGAKWVTFGSGVSANVTAIDVLENKVYIGGPFTRAGGKPSYHFAQWNEPVDSSIINEGPTPTADIHLLQNYPNPFNPMTTISYLIPKSSFVELKVFDLSGKQIKTLVHEFKNVGRHRINFDASGLANGIYFYRLQVNNFAETKKMLVVK